MTSNSSENIENLGSHTLLEGILNFSGKLWQWIKKLNRNYLWPINHAVFTELQKRSKRIFYKNIYKNSIIIVLNWKVPIRSISGRMGKQRSVFSKKKQLLMEPVILINLKTVTQRNQTQNNSIHSIYEFD